MLRHRPIACMDKSLTCTGETGDRITRGAKRATFFSDARVYCTRAWGRVNSTLGYCSSSSSADFFFFNEFFPFLKKINFFAKLSQINQHLSSKSIGNHESSLETWPSARFHENLISITIYSWFIFPPFSTSEAPINTPSPSPFKQFEIKGKILHTTHKFRFFFAGSLKDLFQGSISLRGSIFLLEVSPS